VNSAQNDGAVDREREDTARIVQAVMALTGDPEQKVIGDSVRERWDRLMADGPNPRVITPAPERATGFPVHRRDEVWKAIRTATESISTSVRAKQTAPEPAPVSEPESATAEPEETAEEVERREAIREKQRANAAKARKVKEEKRQNAIAKGLPVPGTKAARAAAGKEVKAPATREAVPPPPGCMNILTPDDELAAGLRTLIEGDPPSTWYTMPDLSGALNYLGSQGGKPQGSNALFRRLMGWGMRYEKDAQNKVVVSQPDLMEIIVPVDELLEGQEQAQAG
jgi:hypothetical protein